MAYLSILFILKSAAQLKNKELAQVTDVVETGANNLNFVSIDDAWYALYHKYVIFIRISAIENCGSYSLDMAPLQTRICGLKARMQGCAIKP